MSKDILNSRNLEERLNELQLEFTNYLNEMEDDEKSLILSSFDLTSDKMTEEDWREAWEGTSDGEEWKNIDSLKDEIDSAQWENGIRLIRDGYFEQFAEDEADNMGYFSGVSSSDWPFSCIDWRRAARELRSDYRQVNFDGETYWYRS